MILYLLLCIFPSIVYGIALPSCEPPTISPNETVQARSVTVYMKGVCDAATVTNRTRIYYTIDASKPVVDVSKYLLPGASIVIESIGKITISALMIADNYDESKVVRKTYEIMPMCSTPNIYPNGGTFSGHVDVNVLPDTQADASSSITYTIIDADTNEIISHGVVSAGDDILVTYIGTFKIQMYAESDSCYKSSPFTSSTFLINPKASNPVITPSDDVYTISATLFFTCSTPSVTMHYTTDGSIPSGESLTVENTKSITIDSIGRHTIKVIAIGSGIDSSDVVTKEIMILTRATSPTFAVTSSYPSIDNKNYVGNIEVTFICEDGGVVYYTTDVSTPTTSSSSTMCNTFIELKAPGSYILRAFTFIADKSVSDIKEEKYVLTRPSYDIHDVHIELPFQVQPLVDTYVVEASLPPSHYFCEDRVIRGRLLQLRNPIGHFDIVQPSNSRGCQERKLELPSVTGRSYNTSTSGWLLYKNSTALEKNRNKLSKRVYGFTYSDAMPTYYPIEYSKLAKEIRQNISKWQVEYEEVAGLGCQLVTNAGFFNISNHGCVGDIIENTNIIQTSSKHNVNFGIRNGKYLIGYIDEIDVRDTSQPFDTLISGIVWLVRDGKSYVAESISKSGDGEDLSSQSTGSSFATVLSARTCIGYDKDGNLLILQVEGKTWERGMSLYEFANFAIELGFFAAINLDGGGSATMTINHTLVSEPSWDCADTDSYNPYRCEKQVSTITCIHAMQPPQITENAEMLTNKPSARPTVFPTYIWERELDDDLMHDDTNNYDDESKTNSTMHGVSELQETLVVYKESTAVLGILLILSLFANYYYYNKKETPRFIGGSTMPGVGSSSVEMAKRPSSRDELSTPKTESRVPAFLNVFKGVSLTASPSPASTNSGQRSPLHPSGSNDWQSKLRNMNFDQDSSDEETGNRNVTADSKTRVPDTKKGRRKSNDNGEETIHLYNHNGSNSKKEKRRSGSSASKIIETISKKASSSIVMSKGQPSAEYARLGSSDDEEPSGNPFK